MVAYSFKSRFAEPIIAGTKGGTIRADRRRHARPGEELQLYVGMRTKQCRLVARKTCLACDPIVVDFQHVGGPRITIVGVRLIDVHRIDRSPELDAFAVFDGFRSFSEMADFWAATHAVDRFEGWHVRWLALPCAP